MGARRILSDYLTKAMSHAEYEQLVDGTVVGRIGCCTGVIAFATNFEKCAEELRSILEDWLLVGIRLGHSLPVIDGIDLNIGRKMQQIALYGWANCPFTLCSEVREPSRNYSCLLAS